MKYTLFFITILITTLISSTVALATLELKDYDFDAIVINSEEWQDVYSGILAAKLTGKEVYFLRNIDQATELPDLIVQKKILLIESKDKKIHSSYQDYLQSKGFTTIIYNYKDNINSQLLEDLKPERIIIIDDIYGYDAIAVAPYAVAKDTFVVFTTNINKIKDQELILYGDIENNIKEQFKDAKIIDKEDRFSNNIEILKELSKNISFNQVTITNGEFIEKSLFNPKSPNLFIGKTNTPKQITAYIAGTDILFATVVGNDLKDLASKMKQDLKTKYNKELGMMLLIGKSRSDQGSGEAIIDVLDQFPITIFDAELNIKSIRYNILTKEIDLTIENKNKLKVYFLPTLTLQDGENKIVPEYKEGLQLIAGEKEKTIVFENITFENTDISGAAKIIYGDSEKSLEREKTLEFDTLPKIEINDISKIKIKSIYYNKLNKAFLIKIENTGDVKTYLDLELLKVIVDGKKIDLSIPEIKDIAPKETKELIIRAKLSSIDIQENEKINIKVYYGQKEGALIKRKTQNLELNITTYTPYIIAGATTLILIILLIIFLKRKTKKNS